MKNSYVIGIVWTAVVVCVISFGATIYFLDNISKEEKHEVNSNNKDDNELESAYQTDESSIRTNNYARLTESVETNNVISKNTTVNNQKNVKDNKKNNIKNTINEELISEEDMENENLEESVESISKNIESFIRPVKGDILNPLSVNELVYSKTLQEWSVHTGIDYDAQLGDEVYSINDGKVKEIKFDYAYGNSIVIEHDNGYESKYSNVTVLDVLKVGDLLEQGQLIGYVAESFGFEAGEETHLHFELIKDEEYLSL